MINTNRGSASAAGSDAPSFTVYSHPKHKHRVMAFLSKTVKRAKTRKVALIEQTLLNFCGKGLTMSEANVEKCISELEMKEVVKIENEEVSFVP